MKIMRTVLMVILAFFVATTGIHAENSPKKENDKSPKTTEKAPKPPEVTSVKIPNSVLNIAKEKTSPNSTQEQPYPQPSERSQELLEK